MRSSKYTLRREQFIRAVSIAEKIITNSGLPEFRKNSKLKFITEVKGYLLHPKKEHKNLRSLSSLESEFFTYWNEASEEPIEKFWNEIQDTGLPYKRKDILKGILFRKKIRNIAELDYVKDAFIIALQGGTLKQDEAELLSNYVCEFERKNGGKI